MNTLYIFEDGNGSDKMHDAFFKAYEREMDIGFSASFQLKNGDNYFFTSVSDFYHSHLRQKTLGQIYAEKGIKSFPITMLAYMNAELHFFNYDELKENMNKRMTVEEDRDYLIKKHQEKREKEKALEEAIIKKQMKLFKNPFYGMEVV